MLKLILLVVACCGACVHPETFRINDKYTVHCRDWDITDCGVNLFYCKEGIDWICQHNVQRWSEEAVARVKGI